MTHDFQTADLRDDEREDELSHAEKNAIMLQQLQNEDDGVESKEGGGA